MIYAFDGTVLYLLLVVPYLNVNHNHLLMALYMPAFSLAILAAMIPGSLSNTVFSSKPLVWFGTISYSLYLYNFTFMLLPQWFRAVFAIGDLFAIAVAVAITVAVGAAGYYLLEAPFIALRARLHDATPDLAPQLAVPEVSVSAQLLPELSHKA